jgi:hypothetical protein
MEADLGGPGTLLDYSTAAHDPRETDMSELLISGLSKTKHELESGVADAESELARTEEYCRQLEDLIGVGKATLHAATQANLHKPTPAARDDLQTPRPSHSAPVTPETKESDSNGESALRKRLIAQAEKSS